MKQIVPIERSLVSGFPRLATLCKIDWSGKRSGQVGFPKTSISTKGVLLVAIPLVMELAFGVTMLGLQNYYREVVEQEAHAKAIIFHANELWLWSTDAVTSRIEGKVFKDAQHTFGDEQKHLDAEYKILEELLVGDQKQLERLDAIKKLVDGIIAIGGQFEDSSGTADFSDFGSKIAVLRGRFNSFQSLQRRIKRLSAEIRSFRAPEELKSQDKAAEVRQVQASINTVIVCSMVLSTILSAALLVYFRRSIQNGVRVLLNNTFRLSESKPLLAPLSSGDELSQVDNSFHKMAVALETATRREKATLNNAADVICVLTPELAITYVNPAATTLLGAESDEIKMQGLKYFVLEPDWPEVENKLQSMRSDTAQVKLECRMVDTQERLVWTSWAIQWSQQDNEYFCVIHDISAAKNLEQLKQEFFAMVSHDLRTPLTSLVCAVNMMGELGSVSGEGRAYLSLAEQTSQYLFTLIQDLLDVERLAAGAFPLFHEIFDVQEVLHSAKSIATPLAERSGIKLGFNKIELQMNADREALLRVLVNLISNAIKFSPAEESVDVETTSSENGVQFTISDRGKGIPEDLQAQIFDRYKQVSLDDSRKHSGFGLGLAICKGLVEAHGGQIGVRSRAGGGTTFWFMIPQSPDSPC